MFSNVFIYTENGTGSHKNNKTSSYNANAPKTQNYIFELTLSKIHILQIFQKFIYLREPTGTTKNVEINNGLFQIAFLIQPFTNQLIYQWNTIIYTKDIHLYTLDQLFLCRWSEVIHRLYTCIFTIHTRFPCGSTFIEEHNGNNESRNSIV